MIEDLDADRLKRLEGILSSGETSIRIAAHALRLSVKGVYRLVIAHPDKFSCIGLQGSVGTYCIALAGYRPIQLVTKE